MADALLGFVGDVCVNRQNPSEVFREVRGILRVPDVMFANLEGACTDDPHPVPSAHQVISAPSRSLDVYAEVGFKVLSLANNHIVDVGYEAMLETRSRLHAQDVSTCGAGACLAEASQPAILNVNGVSIAFLAYASVFPIGYEARSNRPGLAPLRAYNFFREPFPLVHVPGVRPLITTVPDQTDLARMIEDIGRARARADLVVVSFHWGDQSLPCHLTDHETRTARYCIDRGADMVVGHHHHAIRGMEWYRGKPILYGLGHFVFDHLGNVKSAEELLEPDVVQYLRQINATTDPARYFDFPDYYRMTLVAWAVADRTGIRDIGFLPCRLAAEGIVHPLRLDSPEGAEVVRHLEQCNRTQGLKSRVVADAAVRLAGFETMRVVETA